MANYYVRRSWTCFFFAYKYDFDVMSQTEKSNVGPEKRLPYPQWRDPLSSRRSL